MKILASFLLAFLSYSAIGQSLATTIEANIENNQGLEIPVEIQLFSENQTDFYEFVTNTNGYGSTVIESDVEWLQGIGLITSCNGEMLISALVPSDVPEVDYTLSFNYCSQEEIFGCMDSTAINYNPLATDDDGSCIYETDCENPLSILSIDFNANLIGAWAITQQNMGQWVANDTITSGFQSDAICLEDGCYTLNLNLQAQDDSLVFGSVFLIMANEVLIEEEIGSGFVSIDFNVGEGCDDNDILGCTDSTATNYNPLATVDDGSCEYDNNGCNGVESVLLINNQDAEGTWNISNLEGEVFIEGVLEPEFTDYSVCLEDGCYTLNLFDVDVSGGNQAGFFTLWVGDLIGANNWLESGSATYDFIVGDGCDGWISGCTDPNALNYNPEAEFDDGSCEYPPAENDLCADAIFIEPGEHLINNSQAVNNEDIWGECWNFGSGEGEQTSVWYTFTTPEEPASIHLEAYADGTNSLMDTQFGLFLDCGAEMIYCDGNSGAGLLSAFHFECGELEPGTDYILMIDGWNGDAGTAILGYDVNFECDSEVFGCTDPEAINYNPNATVDDNSCEYECTDVYLGFDYFNGAPDDSSYTLMNWTITNYNNEVVEGGDWYNWAPQFDLCLTTGCYTFTLNNVSPNWNGIYNLHTNNEELASGVFTGENETLQFNFGVNESGCNDSTSVYGCTDPEAINYNPDANVDDGTCEYEECEANSVLLIIETGTWAEEVSWNVVQDGNELYGDGIYENNSEYTYNLCLEDGCYAFEMFDEYGDGWNGASFTLVLDNDIIVQGGLESGEYGNINFGINSDDCGDNEVYGCTDPAANNYNPLATIDDGSCYYVDSCQFIVEPYFISCSSYEFFASTLSGNVVDGIWSINGEIVEDNNSATYFEFTEPGSYEVCFTGQSDACGGLSEGCATIYIDPACFDLCPELYSTSLDSCNYVFYLQNSDSIQNVIWYPGDGNIIEGSSVFTYQYESTGFYTVCAVIEGVDCQEVCMEIYAQSCEGDIFGCTDPDAINYDPDATVDDGSCIYDSDCDGFEGTFGLSSNYEYSGWWEISNTETGEYVVGDTIPVDVQYISDFCLEDGCYNIQLNLFSDSEFNASVSVVVGGEIIIVEFLVAGEYNVDFQVGEGCSDEILGCTDPEALNYNPDATIDDGSCIYDSDCTGIDGALILDSDFEISGWWGITNSETGQYVTSDTIQGGINYFDLCLEDGCYDIYLDLNANLQAEVGVSLVFGNDDVFSINVPAGEYTYDFEVGSGCDSEEVYGCTDPVAVNFNPSATIDDGSCVYEFECNIGFAIIPDSTGENTIWIMPTFELDNLVEILWDFGDGSTSTEIFPVHEYAGDGPYTLCITATLIADGTTCESTFCAEISGAMLGSGLLSSGFSINVISNSTLSINEESHEFDMQLYPNPAASGINLSYNSISSGSELIRIYDLTGKLIDEIQFNVAVGQNQKFIDIEHLPNGIYVLSLRNISNKRFVKSD